MGIITAWFWLTVLLLVVDVLAIAAIVVLIFVWR